ncbi:MAG: PadR family transcriptional regulator [Candidatus Thorarchaeota archaeon]
MAQKQMKKWVKQTARVPRGYLRFQFLTLLREEPMSGSEMADRIEQDTDGEYRPGSGSVYPVLKKLHESGFIDKLLIEDGVQRYVLTEKGKSFFDENEHVMEDVRKRLDAVEVPFMSLFQKQPHFRSYFMRISRFMMALSELPEEYWNSELIDRLDEVLSSSANGLESILESVQRRNL